ncbi:MAG: DUF3276 family protein [Chitinophagaceae bacterium]
MAYENNEKKPAYGDSSAGKAESIYSKRIRAGKRRTYFFDVRATRGNDYYLTITESRKRFDDNGYDRHKIFLYKEDFNKFIKALGEAVDYVKTDLMPDFDFDAFNHDDQPEDDRPVSAENGHSDLAAQSPAEPVIPAAVEQPDTAPDTGNEEVDKW